MVECLASDCAKALLRVHNVEINVQNKLGDTPLHNAAWKGHAEVVALLLEKGMVVYRTRLLVVLCTAALHLNQGPLPTSETMRTRSPMIFLQRILKWVAC